MIQRIATLCRYLTGNLLYSLSGVLYLIGALVYYWLAFQQPSPETAYFVLVLGLFGAVVTFLLTLSVAARANQAVNFPLLVRLPSRIEYLTAVLLTAFSLGLALQLLAASLALLRNGPTLSLAQVLEIPPIWIAFNILAATLALHASELVTAGWSRVYLYGTLALLLFLQGNHPQVLRWLADRFLAMGNWLNQQGAAAASTPVRNFAGWLTRDAPNWLAQALDYLFWPIQAITQAVTSGQFSRAQALAPAVLLLYATIIFMLAADLFANKDLHLHE
jgi:hypothetical protein